MATTKEFNISSNAVTVLNQTAEATNNARKELKELQKQMLSMDADSAEFQKAAARAGELKDQMNDAADAIRTSTGPALESMNNTFSIMQGQLMNLDFGGLGQSFTSLGRAVEKINIKSLKDELGGLVKGLGNLAGAIISNPILALGGAVALLVLNFDKINNALNGTTEKIEKLGKANEDLQRQNIIIEGRLNIEKKLNGESRKTRELELESVKNNIQVAKNELEIARRTGDVNAIREAENKLIALRNQLSGVTAEWEANRVKLVEEAKNQTIKGYKEAEAERRAIQQFEDARQQTLDEIVKKQTMIKGLLEQEKLLGQEVYKTERANFVEKDIETKKVKVESEKQKQLQKELNQLIEEENLLRKVKGAIATDTTVQDLAAKEKEKEKVLTTRETLGQVYDLELEYNLLLVDAEKAKQDALTATWMEGHKTRSVISDEYRKQLIEADKQVYEARWALASASVDLLGTIFQKNKKAADIAFALDKGLAIAKVVVDTQAEIAGYYAANAAAGPVGMAVASTQALAAKIRAATSIATIAAASVAKFASGGASSANLGGGVGGGGGGTQAPSPANFAFLGMQPQQQPPLQAYVVSGQVSSNLEAQQLINNQARLGG